MHWKLISTRGVLWRLVASGNRWNKQMTPREETNQTYTPVYSRNWPNRNSHFTKVIVFRLWAICHAITSKSSENVYKWRNVRNFRLLTFAHNGHSRGRGAKLEIFRGLENESVYATFLHTLENMKQRWRRYYLTRSYRCMWNVKTAMTGNDHFTVFSASLLARRLPSS